MTFTIEERIQIARAGLSAAEWDKRVADLVRSYADTCDGEWGAVQGPGSKDYEQFVDGAILTLEGRGL